MQVTANSNNIYTSNTNKVSQNKEEKAGNILPLDKLLDEEGSNFLDELLVGMSEEDKIGVKLSLSFMLSIKSESVIDGKLHIERETGELDTQSILSKLDRLSKNKNVVSEFSVVREKIVNELKNYYTNRTEVNINAQEDSVVDKFLEDLYSKESIDSASILVKEDMQNKVNEYAKTLGDELGDIEKSKMLNDYKQELFQGYKEILETLNNETPSLKQQGIMKVLLDENTKEISFLKSLLSDKM